MARYIINTPIKVSKTKIVKPGGPPVELSGKIVDSLPPHAVTRVDEPEPEKPTETGKGGAGGKESGDSKATGK